MTLNKCDILGLGEIKQNARLFIGKCKTDMAYTILHLQTIHFSPTFF